MNEEGVQANDEARLEDRVEAQANAESIVLLVQILAQLLERPRRPVQEILFSGEAKDWPAYKTRILACAENENISHTLERSIVDELPSAGIILDKGNPSHASQIKAVEDCAQMMNIFMLGQKSAVMINGVTMIKDRGRKLGSLYEVWK